MEGDFHQRDVFVWPHLMMPIQMMEFPPDPQPGDTTPRAPIRSYYYTSVQGDEVRKDEIEQRLWTIGLEPRVFKRPRTRNSKGVDISLTKDALCHAFDDHFDLAVLIAGDADYIPLIEELKRRGKLVYLAFHEDADIDARLIRTADWYRSIEFDAFEVKPIEQRSRG